MRESFSKSCIFVLIGDSKRKRVVPPMSFDECERRAGLHKSWARYKAQQFVAEWNVIKLAIGQQKRALLELRRESEQLYQQALEVGLTVFICTVSSLCIYPSLRLTSFFILAV